MANQRLLLASLWGGSRIAIADLWAQVVIAGRRSGPVWADPTALVGKVNFALDRILSARISIEHRTSKQIGPLRAPRAVDQASDTCRRSRARQMCCVATTPHRESHVLITDIVIFAAHPEVPSPGDERRATAPLRRCLGSAPQGQDCDDAAGGCGGLSDPSHCLQSPPAPAFQRPDRPKARSVRGDLDR